VTNEPKNTGTNPVEEIVGKIYATYLGGGTFDREASFFELGGNSLVAIQMINKLREAFELDIPLRGFDQNSSVAAISQQIANKLLEEPAHA
jgi:acyl carrier protein